VRRTIVVVNVSRKGYTPEKIDVAANEEITLVFTRSEDTECGAEVEIPSLKVKNRCRSTSRWRSRSRRTSRARSVSSAAWT